MEHPIPRDALPPIVKNVTNPQGPRAARLGTARAALPLPPRDLVTAIYQLAYDDDEEIRTVAEGSLRKLDPVVLESALTAELDARVLDRLADVYADRPDILQRITLSRAAEDETLARIAGRGDEAMTELIAGMDQRLTRSPELVTAIYMNTKTRMSTADRVLELAVRSGLQLENIPAFREMAAAIRDELITEPTGERLPDDSAFDNVLRLGEVIAAVESPEALAEAEVAADPSVPAEANKRRVALDSALSKMTVSQKIRMALLGGVSHRSRLVRDPNRLVALAAIKSPKVTDTEVVAYAQSRSVPEDVVRYIAQRREWLRTYQVKRSLALNPKCPLSETLRLLPHLREPDLRSLVGNKNVPNTVSTAARNLLDARRKARDGGK